MTPTDDAGLVESALPNSPFTLFRTWYAHAEQIIRPEPGAMTLATVGPDGCPSARVVLLRGFDERGFVFFTNYLGRKGRELTGHPLAALNLYWPALERQVRVEGRAEQVEAEISDAYFRARPHGHRIGALASPQSEVVPDRHFLEKRQEAFEKQYPDDVPRPDTWGGFRVVPARIEFWHGQPNRLHDRIRYRRDDEGDWIIERLAP